MADFISRIAPKGEIGSQSQILNVDINEEAWAAATKCEDEDVKASSAKDKDEDVHEDDDLFCSSDDISPVTEATSRERRSAFMILKCLQLDGLL